MHSARITTSDVGSGVSGNSGAAQVRRACPLETVRVLHVIDSLLAGGTERQLVELLKGLQARDDIICELLILSTDVHYEDFARVSCPTHFLPRRSRYDPSVFPRMHRILRTFQPHIVHSWNAMCSIYAAPLAKLAGARFINGYVRAAANTLSLRNRDYFRGKLTMPLSDVVIANSQAGLAAYGVPPGKGIFIHNGFDQERLKNVLPTGQVREALGIVTPYVVGMVASFSDFKDYDTFFRAARDVTSAREDVTFVAVGDGANFARFQAELSPQRFPRVGLLGGRADVESIVNAFTIGVLTSNTQLHGEGIANAIMEYMALGKPVVATDCGGNAELVADGNTGYLIGGGDAGSLTQRVVRLLDDPVLARTLGENGRTRIREEFSLQRMVDAYIGLYRDLLKHTR